MFSSIRTFITLVTLAAANWFLLTLETSSAPDRGMLLLALLFVPLMAAAAMYPLHFDYKTTIILDTVVIVAAALTLEPALAMLAIGSGTALGMLLRRRNGLEALFNTAQVMLQVGIASQLLLWSGWSLDSANMRLDSYAALLIAGGSIFLLNTTLMSIVIGLQTGLDAATIWLRSVTRNDTIEQISQVVLGFFAAYLLTVAPFTLPILVFPILVIYCSLQRWTQLRSDTIEAVQGLADLVDVRDPYTYSHARRVAAFAREIATDMGLGYEDVALIERAGYVHDLGKLVIDRSVLAKPGRLTDQEWLAFEQHPVVGAEMLARFSEFSDGLAFVRAHHERFDGMGYPDRLRGEEIPLGARILAVADAFDAMSSARPYRPALSREMVLGELERGRGTQWDTVVVEHLLNLIEQGKIILPAGQEHPYIVDGSGQVVDFNQPGLAPAAEPSAA